MSKKKKSKFLLSSSNLKKLLPIFKKKKSSIFRPFILGISVGLWSDKQFQQLWKLKVRFDWVSKIRKVEFFFAREL